MKIGACGIACEVCSYSVGRTCEGCLAGDDEATAKKSEMRKAKLGSSSAALKWALRASVGSSLGECHRTTVGSRTEGLLGEAFLDIWKE